MAVMQWQWPQKWGSLAPSKIAGSLKKKIKKYILHAKFCAVASINTWPLTPALKSFLGLCAVVTHNYD